MRTDPAPARTPAFFQTCAGTVTATSLSRTCRSLLPDLHRGAEALMVTVRVPFKSVSSTIVTAKLALLCPAGMVTKPGTIADAASLEVRVTTRSAANVGD